MENISKDVLQVLSRVVRPSILMKFRVNSKLKNKVEIHIMWKDLVINNFPLAYYKNHLERGDSWFEIFVLLCQVHRLIKTLHVAIDITKFPRIGANDMDMLINAKIIWPAIENWWWDKELYESYEEWFDKLIYYSSPVFNRNSHGFVKIRLRKLLDIIVKNYGMSHEYKLFSESSKNSNNNPSVYTTYTVDTTSFKWVKQYVSSPYSSHVNKWQEIQVESTPKKLFKSKIPDKYYVWVPL